MGFLDFFWHLLNFAAPAAGLAFVVALVGQLWRPATPWLAGLVRRWAVNALVGALVLLAGLWGLGRDGKMLTYGALVLAVASAHWVQARGWRQAAGNTAGKPFAK